MLGVEILWVFGFFSIFSVPLVQVRRDGRGRRCGWMDGRGEVEEQHLQWVLDIMVQLRRTFWLSRHTKTPVHTNTRKGGYTNNWTLIPQLPQQPDGCKPDIRMKTSSTFSPWSLFFSRSDHGSSSHTWIFIPNFMFLIHREAHRHNVSWISKVWAAQHRWRHNNINANGITGGESLKVSLYLFTLALLNSFSRISRVTGVLDGGLFDSKSVQQCDEKVLPSFQALSSSFFKTPLRSYRFSWFYPSFYENTWFLEKAEGPWWPWLLRQELCVGVGFGTG